MAINDFKETEPICLCRYRCEEDFSFWVWIENWFTQLWRLRTLKSIVSKLEIKGSLMLPNPKLC